jgi:hypothetical protein
LRRQPRANGFICVAPGARRSRCTTRKGFRDVQHHLAHSRAMAQGPHGAVRPLALQDLRLMSLEELWDQVGADIYRFEARAEEFPSAGR